MEIWTYARENDFIIVTYDEDFYEWQQLKDKQILGDKNVQGNRLRPLYWDGETAGRIANTIQGVF